MRQRGEHYLRAYASVPKSKIAVANTAINIVQRLGGPLATTLVAVVMSLSASGIPLSGPHPFMIAFVLLAGLNLILLGAASCLPVLINSNTSESVAGSLRKI
jgi:type IV secretory pathway VirB2 component (pilin)